VKEIRELAMNAKVVSVNISIDKGTKKMPVGTGEFLEEHGMKGDAHAGNWHRMVSLLAMESIEKIKAKLPEVSPGDFAENITTEGIDLCHLPIGTKLKVGETIQEVTQIGKECHHGCEIYHQVGECVMPKEGIFTKILKGGTVKEGDSIEIV
jgi:MOSC domain-containing protein YiiM